jgi:hypothetical protein
MPVTLLEGPAWVGGSILGALASTLADALAGSRGGRVAGSAHGAAASRSSTLATVVVAGACGGLGALDDLAGGASDKGLRGHLGALARGEVTTGSVKIVGLGLTGLAGAAIVDRADRTGLRPRGRGVIATVVGGAVIAAAANAVNLFDLRPGRALKVTVAAALPLVPGTPAAAAVGSSLGVAGSDLAATAMLGDTGANAAGALVGLAVVERSGLLGRAVALAGLTALTLASERVSFTKVIEGNPTLRRIDEWGRAPR